MQNECIQRLGGRIVSIQPETPNPSPNPTEAPRTQHLQCTLHQAAKQEVKQELQLPGHVV